MIPGRLLVWDTEFVAQTAQDAAALHSRLAVEQTGEPDRGHHGGDGAVGGKDRGRNRAHAECEAFLVQGPAPVADQREFPAKRADVGETLGGVGVQSVAQRLVDALGIVESQKCTPERGALDRQGDPMSTVIVTPDLRSTLSTMTTRSTSNLR